MRTVYHRFPTSFDLDFELRRQFADALQCLRKLHTTHTTTRKGLNLVKCEVTVQIAKDKTGFVSMEMFPNLEEVTEMADFRMVIRETKLTAKSRIPVSENSFLIRLMDKGAVTEVTVAKEGKMGEMDAMDLRSLIRDACP
ncbi:MAG: hypothetical protein QHG99_07040 [Methanomicrobiales archaeon]|nr:hypothetical protein [Methanomicrobiales archaeon]